MSKSTSVIPTTQTVNKSPLEPRSDSTQVSTVPPALIACTIMPLPSPAPLVHVNWKHLQQLSVAVFPWPAKPYESVSLTIIGWYLSHENASAPDDAKHAFCAPAAAGWLFWLQDCTGPFAPGERFEAYPQAGSQLGVDDGESVRVGADTVVI